METLISRCAGLDVHKETVEADVRRIEPDGRLQHQTRQWGTMTRDLVAMADWMAAQGVTHVAMESTGVFWKPIFNILESRFSLESAQVLDLFAGTGALGIEARRNKNLEDVGEHIGRDARAVVFDRD